MPEGSAVDDDDLRVSAADLAPVGDGAGEDALELLDGQVVDGDLLVDDRAHAHDAHLVVLDLGDIVFVLELGLGEHVGVADLDSALRDLRDALAGTAALNGDLDAGVLSHELLGGCLAKRLEGGGADGRHVAGEALSGSGGAARRAACSAVATTTRKPQARESHGRAGGEAEEPTAADRLTLQELTLHFNDSPFGCASSIP